MTNYDETYVNELITAATLRGRMSVAEFKKFTEIDKNAGYKYELIEAERFLRKSGVIR